MLQHHTGAHRVDLFSTDVPLQHHGRNLPPYPVEGAPRAHPVSGKVDFRNPTVIAVTGAFWRTPPRASDSFTSHFQEFVPANKILFFSHWAWLQHILMRRDPGLQASTSAVFTGDNAPGSRGAAVSFQIPGGIVVN